MPSILKRNLLPFFLLSFVLLVYLNNLSPSVYGGDVGDFVTAATVMGVPHASGYPLFVFLGFLLTRIHYMTPAYMVGIISVVSSALAIFIFYLLALEMTKNKFISAVSSLILAFTYFFWFFAEIAEVFALNNFFVLILTFLGYLYYKYKDTKYIYALAFFTGLSMTNNYIISFIFPTLLIMVLSNFRKLLANPKIIVKCILLGLLGLSVYIYLPIAASHNPPVNWDNPSNLHNFLRMVLRKDYGTFGVGFVPNLVFMQRVLIQKDYFVSLIGQLTFPVVFIVLIGAYKLFRTDKKLFFSFVLSFVLSGPVFIGLVGLPLLSTFLVGVYERFFSMSSVVLMFFFPIGLLTFVEFFNKILKKKTYQNLFIAVFLIVPLILFRYNFEKTNLSHVWIGDNLALDLISSLPKGATFLPVGDTPLFNSWYMVYARGERTDLKLVNHIMNDSLVKLQDAYLKKHPKEKVSQDITALTLKDLANRTNVFSNAQIQVSKGQPLIWMPWGLNFKLLTSAKQIPTEQQFLDLQDRIWSKFLNTPSELKSNDPGYNGSTISDISSVYSGAMMSEGAFVNNYYKDTKLALALFNKAQELSPQNSKAYFSAGFIYTEQKQCQLAIDNVNEGLKFSPFDKMSYYLLYYNYKFCFNDITKANGIVEKYHQLFNSDFYKDMPGVIKNYESP